MQPTDATRKAGSALLRSQRGPHHQLSTDRGPLLPWAQLLFSIQVQSISASRKALPESAAPFPHRGHITRIR